MSYDSYYHCDWYVGVVSVVCCLFFVVCGLFVFVRALMCVVCCFVLLSEVLIS